MQIYPDILGTDAVSDSRQMIIDRENSIKSSFSGPRAPTVTAEDVGCIWYCTADSNFYGLYSIDEDSSNPVWQKLVTPTKLNAMDLGTPTTETLYVDLEGAPCEAKKDMFVLVEHTILPVENYEITNNGMRVTFVSPIPAGLKLEIRWFVQEVIGRDGATFVPSIVNNVLTWDNDQGLVNPPDLDFNANLAEIENFANEQIVAIKDSSDAEIAKINNTGSTQVATVQSSGASQVNLVKQTAQEYINTMDGKITEVLNGAAEAAESAEAAAASAASVDADNIVNLDNNQTITGRKTFQDNLIYAKSTAMDQAASSLSSAVERGLMITDKNNKRIGNFFTAQQTDGQLRTYMCSSREIDGATVYKYAEIRQNTNGTAHFNIACDSALAPTPPASDSSTKIATTAWVNNNAVNLTNNQTINGNKTFTGYVESRSSVADVSINMRNMNDDYTTTPTEYQARNFRALDKNSKILGDVRFRSETNGSRTATIVARNAISGSEVSGNLGVGVDKNGSAFTFAPTPGVSDNSTKIATTAFVKSQIQEVTAAPSSYVSGVLYVIPE